MTKKSNSEQPASPKRARNYGTIVYPESAPDGWIDTLREMHIPAFISPLHDKDVLADGTPKKAHYHVLLMFTGNKSTKQVEDVVRQFGGIHPVIIESLPAQARYLIHLDDPDKAQYSERDVIALSGANYTAVTHIPSDDIGIVREMINFIRTNQIISFARLADYCAENNERWLSVLTLKHLHFFFKEYIKSLCWTLATGKEEPDYKGAKNENESKIREC